MIEGTDQRTDEERSFYRHATRPDWGVAVLLWHAEGKRGYRFSDGNTRVFKRGYFHLMRTTEPNPAERDQLTAYLRHERSPSRRATASRPAKPRSDISLNDQIEYFRSQFPDGFRGQKWQHAHRRAPRRALQRHRDRAIELARDRLSRDAIDEALRAGQAVQVVADLVAVLAATDLVTAAHRNKLLGLADWQAERLARSLRELLWGDLSLRTRLGGWISSLAVATSSKTATWGLTTAPLALVHPTEHVAVRYSSFTAQGEQMVPPYAPGRFASASRYQGALAVAQQVRDRLRAHGLEPADLFDVHDFMSVTLRADALRAIAARKSATRPVDAAPSSAAPDSEEAERVAA